MERLINTSPRYLFFTGKGGVGKTSMSCCTAIGLADKGSKVLLISTDPASNLDEILSTQLDNRPTQVSFHDRLFAMNIDPMKAAADYRERIVGPYRGVLPDEAVTSIEEQLSGACTVEIASFNEFTKLIADDSLTALFDHIILDTAPTGHTLRLLSLPSAWNDFIINNKTGSSCLGPLAGLKEQRLIYQKAIESLQSRNKTLLVLVSRLEQISLVEASKASTELSALGMSNQYLILNGLFTSSSEDKTAVTFEQRSKRALWDIPDNIAGLPQTIVPFLPNGLPTPDNMTKLIYGELPAYKANSANALTHHNRHITPITDQWGTFIEKLSTRKNGLIMIMGKGGVGKTTVASAIAIDLFRKGHKVHLSTTDPAAHLLQTIGQELPQLHISRIDPKVEVERYVGDTLEKNRTTMSPDDLALLEEELRSPCIEEIAVFQAFAHIVDRACNEIVVLDTAPTGHTLLLLDATASYHKEVTYNSNNVPESVSKLLPRLTDPGFTRIIITTLPEATPVHEAARLQDDLRRANIEPFGWVINQSFSVSDTNDPQLIQRGLNEQRYISEVHDIQPVNRVILPWSADIFDMLGFYGSHERPNQTALENTINLSEAELL